MSRALTADSRNVWTNHNDNNRTGGTLAETILTTSNVNGASFGKIFERSVDDQVYAQPLWLANVTIGGSTRNVLYVATVNGTVYAFDADNAAASSPIASRNLIPSGWTAITNTDMTGACGGGYNDFSGKMSIVGTPVIDVAAGTMFVVVRSKSGTTFQQKLHALDVTSSTLAERTGSPVVISASVPGTGDGSSGGNVAFDNQREAQRAGLALAGGRVYISWASHCDWRPYHGWMIGYNASTLAQTFVWNESPNGNMGGIWQAGQPPAVDSTGKIYVMTGNGTSDARTGGSAYGHSFVKLDPTLASPVTSWFTPFDVDSANAADADLGSAGVLIPPDVTTRVIGGGKPGKLFVLNSASLGGYQSGSDSQVVQSFSAAAGHIHGSPVYYNAPGINKKLVYLWSEYDYLKAFEWNAGGSGTMTSTPYKTSTMRVPDGMPGAMLAISANDGIDNTGILWATHPFSGDANHTSQPGILRAFNAKDVTIELWNSKANAADDFGLFGKYVPPTIANGKVFVATHSNKIAVYGLKAASTNLALNKPATASSVEAAGLEASKAVDGSGTTRWSSQFSDPQWIYVDLGSTMSVNQVILKWEAAYASAFQIQTSTDATNWTTVYSTTTGTGGNQTINFTATNARYVRMYGTARGTPYGYSLWELEVYGPGGTGTGLRGEYFDNMDLTVSKVVRTDATVDFNWGTGTPDATVGADTFSARWTGQVEAPESGTFTFCTDTDDGGRLWVNGVQVVNAWFDQALGTQECGTISLTAGTKYSITMEMYENAGNAGAKLFWAIPSNPTHVIIPQTRLYLPAGGPPAAPTGLTATAGNAQVSLAWNASSGATSYNVKRSTTSGSGYTTIAPNVTTTSYTNTGLTNGTTYYYVVSAVNASGESANSAQASATPTAGCTTARIAYWKFDETSGLTAADQSCYVNNGTLRNYTAFDSQPGRIGTALQFNGSTHWVRVPDSSSLDSIATANKVSVSVWVKKNASQAGWAVPVSRQYQTGGAEHFGMSFLDNKPTWLIATHLTGTSGCTYATASGTGVWIHLAGTWDGATARLYVNGTEVCNFARSVSLTADTSPLVIGGNANSSADDAQEKFAGIIDEMAIYNRALTAAEVSAIAAGGTPPSN